MTPESARIRQLINGLSYTVEVLECLDALDARLEAAERERDELFLQNEACGNSIVDAERERDEAWAAFDNEADQATGWIHRAKAAERLAEQLTHALQCAQGFFQGADLQNCDTYALITEALASVEGAGE